MALSEIVNPAEGREFKSRLEQVLALVTQWLECRSYERFKFGFVSVNSNFLNHELSTGSNGRWIGDTSPPTLRMLNFARLRTSSQSLP